MNLIFSMLLSSNSLLLLFIVIEHFIGDAFSQKNKYFILKVALFFSILPLGSVKTLIFTVINYYFPTVNMMDLSISGKIQTFVVTPVGFSINTTYRNNLIILLVWFSISVIMFIVCLRKQYIFRQRVLNTIQKSTAPETLNLLKKHMRLLSINKNIRIYVTNMEISPFTMGLIDDPIIVMPTISDLYKQELIIQHELYHIKGHDAFIKFLQVVVVRIFWFNPLVYLLDSYLNRFCELACDESVTSTLSGNDRKKYAYLIVNLASLGDSHINPYISPFSTNKNTIKERINYILMRNSKKSQLTILLTVGMVFISSIPALAYQSPKTLVFEGQLQNDYVPMNSNQSVTFKEFNTLVELQMEYDTQFTDIDGHIYKVSPSGNDAKINCQHDLVDGVYEKHTKNKDGSCVTKAYDAQRCRKCGTIVLGSFISETKYANCPH